MINKNGMKVYRSYAMEGACVMALLAVWLWGVGLYGFSSWHTVRDLLIGWLALFLGQCLAGESLRGRLWLGSCMIPVLWMAVFPPILVASAEGWNVNFGEIASYYKVALFWGIFSALLFSLGRRYRWLRIPAAGLYGAVTFFFSLMALSYTGYYFVFHTAFVADDMLPVVQTSFREAKGFLLLHANMFVLVVVAAGLLLGLFGLCRLAWHCMGGEPVALGKWKSAAVLFVCALLGMQLSGNVKDGFPFVEYRRAKQFIENVKSAGAAHQQNLAGFHLDAAKTLSDTLPGIVILLIGESETSVHMSAFNPAHEGETTPWLSAQSEATGFYLFPKSYSNFPQTVQSLGMFLTGMNQYNGRVLTETLSILDVAKAAGYKTWWLSNHDKLMNSDSPAVMVSGWADEERWTSPSMGDDRELLEFLKEVPTEGNHFVVIWLMGSHTRYQERVPKDFPQVQVPGHEEIENQYDTTVVYTDQVISEIFDYAKAHMHLQSMAYCSDHGEDMKLGHSAGVFSFDMIRVPLFVYLSDDYRTAYPETAAALSAHKADVFTNDLMFDTMSGLLQAPSREYEARYDLSNKAYDLPLSKAVSKHGAVRISDDV